MTPQEAWNIVAQRCYTSAGADRDDMLVVCDALAVLAEHLNLPDRHLAAKAFLDATRNADQAQLRFEQLIPPAEDPTNA